MDVKNVKGLTSEDVELSRRAYGSNQLTPQETETFWDKFGDNLKDPMIFILIVALGIVAVLSIFGYTPWYEGVGIAAAVALATFVATGSEFKNEQTFQKLQEDASRIMVKIFRNGHLTELSIDEVVVGDIILLQAGDKIPADGVIIQNGIKVNQAMLNGEPEPVKKTASRIINGATERVTISAPNGKMARVTINIPGLDNPHAVFRGTVVEEGEAVMKVMTVGDATMMGKLVEELKTGDRPGPMRIKLAKLADDIANFGYIGATFIALAFLFHAFIMSNWTSPMDWSGVLSYFALTEIGLIIKEFVTAVILAAIIIVVAVPEGLPMMIAIVLAINMKKLLNDNVLVRQLLGIETSGSMNILFSDKTGTITEGKLQATAFINLNSKGVIEESSSFYGDNSMIVKLLNIAIRENMSCIPDTEAKGLFVGGNATERALARFVDADIQDFDTGVIEKIDEVLFSSARKFSATHLRMENNNTQVFIKGASEIILANCTGHYDQNGNIRIFSGEAEKASLQTAMNCRSIEGFRVIGLATAEEMPNKETGKLPANMTLIGFALIRDEVRNTSKETIELLQGAGIQTVMLTGDRHGTAVKIARDTGIIEPAEDAIAISSSQLATMSDKEVKEIIPKLRVISRCLPQDKTRLVKLAQELGMVVGMTGDGVNDSPALANADIGFGLGSGTEAAKEASDIVVLDDNISSIANAVHYGRSIYRSIQKFIVFQLTVNVSAIATAFLGPFLGFELPLTMIQLLWINLIMDTLAALAFSGEPPLAKHMEEQPKNREEKLITKEMWTSILCNGAFITALCVFFLKSSFLQSYFGTQEVFLTAFFGMFVFLNNFNKFNVRVEELDLFDHITKNKGFLQVVGMIFVVQILITYFGGEMFRTVPLTPEHWIIVTLLSFLIIPFDMIRKFIYGARK